MSPTTRLVYRAVTAAIAWVAVAYMMHRRPTVPVRWFIVAVAVLVAAYRTIVVTEPWMPEAVAAWFRSGDVAALMWLLVVAGLAILPRTWARR